MSKLNAVTINHLVNLYTNSVAHLNSRYTRCTDVVLHWHSVVAYTTNVTITDVCRGPSGPCPH